jgi:DNA repair protein RecN (Recombination protein N)
MDEVDFGFAPNVGEPSRPLRVIASSGEISRVMLATKAVLAKHDRVPVLVFDEIDANVGGEMGNAIGARLSAIAGNHQVLCITHLPQVAVHGRTHFAVQKEVRTDRTYTRATTLVGRERVEEIGRMLGGSNFTSVTLKHAEEMLNAIVA